MVPMGGSPSVSNLPSCTHLSFTEAPGISKKHSFDYCFLCKEYFIEKSTKHKTTIIYKIYTTNHHIEYKHKYIITKCGKINKTHCTTDKKADEGSSSTYIRLLSHVKTSVPVSRFDVYNTN